QMAALTRVGADCYRSLAWCTQTALEFLGVTLGQRRIFNFIRWVTARVERSDALNFQHSQWACATDSGVQQEHLGSLSQNGHIHSQIKKPLESGCMHNQRLKPWLYPTNIKTLSVVLCLWVTR